MTEITDEGFVRLFGEVCLMEEGPVPSGGLLGGRRALVTGASRGIGRDIAMALAPEGADVFINHRSHDDEAECVGTGSRAWGTTRGCTPPTCPTWSRSGA